MDLSLRADKAQEKVVVAVACTYEYLSFLIMVFMTDQVSGAVGI